MSRTCLINTILLAYILLPWQLQAQEKDLKTIISLGKSATALIQTKHNRGGTAFCISASGWFVTHQYALAGSKEGDSTNLILNTGEDDEKTIKAQIIGVDDKEQLALLKVDGTKYPFLPLGNDSDLIETNQVTAFGFPVAKLQAEHEYPGVTVSTARITALRKREGKLNVIQLDKTLHPGNSGGPILDSQGNVVGIVHRKFRDLPGVTAISVTELKRFIQTPLIRFETITLDEDTSRKEQTFPINVISFRNAPTDRQVEMEIMHDGAKPRKFRASRVKKGAYQVKAVVMPGAAEAEMLNIEIQFTGGSLVGQTRDIPLRVGKKTINLSQVSRIEAGKGDTKKVILDGQVLTGPLVISKRAKIDFGGASTRLDFSQATSVTIKPIPRKVPNISYRIVIRDGQKIVAEKSGRFAIGTDTKIAQPKKKAIPASMELTPPQLTKDQTIVKLPAPIDNVAFGAGGRLLIFHLKKLQQLAFFDVSLAKVVKYVSLSSNDIAYAAGRDKLFVGLRDLRLMQRYDLTTFEREVTVDAPQGGISAMAIGAEATTPLIVLATRSAKKSYLIDTATMKAKPLNWRGWSGGAWGPVHVHASHDGSAAIACGGGWAGSEIITFVGGKIASSTKGGYTQGRMFMAGNGSLAFREKGGILRADLASGVKGIEGASFPAISNAYSLAFTNHKNKPALTVFGNNDPKRIATIRNLPELAQNSALPIQKRVLLIPQADVLVTLGKGSDHLILRPFDLEKTLEKGEIDYLFIESAPKLQVKRGNTYEYSVNVRSSKGGLTFSLQAGPEGMSISKSGKLSWDVPRNYIGKESPIIIQVSNESGQETFQTYRLKIVE